MIALPKSPVFTLFDSEKMERTDSNHNGDHLYIFLIQSKISYGPKML